MLVVVSTVIWERDSTCDLKAAKGKVIKYRELCSVMRMGEAKFPGFE